MRKRKLWVNSSQIWKAQFCNLTPSDIFFLASEHVRTQIKRIIYLPLVFRSQEIHLSSQPCISSKSRNVRSCKWLKFKCNRWAQYRSGIKTYTSQLQWNTAQSSFVFCSQKELIKTSKLKTIHLKVEKSLVFSLLCIPHEKCSLQAALGPEWAECDIPFGSRGSFVTEYYGLMIGSCKYH